MGKDQKSSQSQGGKGAVTASQRPPDAGRQGMPEGKGASNLRVEEIMSTEVACVTPESSVREAAELMRDRDVGFLPVCEKDNTVVGVVTDRDLVLGVLATDRPYDTAIEEVMTPDPVTCSIGDPLSECERLMSENQINRMVVLGEDGKIAGVVSLQDLAQVESEHKVGDLVADVRLGEADTSGR